MPRLRCGGSYRPRFSHDLFAVDAMWCSHCQQDVPSIARLGSERSCPRCHAALKAAWNGGALNGALDAGIELDALPSKPGGPPLLPAETDNLQLVLRKLNRTRPTPVERQSPVTRLRLFDPGEAKPQAAAAVEKLPAAKLVDKKARRENAPAAVPLVIGLAGLLVGAGLIGTGMAIDQPLMWRWGISAAIVGQGVLTTGIAGISLRLWRQNRRASQQIDGVAVQVTQLGARRAA